jgi:integrase/recombinase XerC/integrase/recombinase XerD
MQKEVSVLNNELRLFRNNILHALNFFAELLKPNTARGYYKDILEFLTASEYRLDIKTVLSYFKRLVGCGYTKATIDRKRAALSKFFQFLEEYKLIDKNVFSTQTFKMFYKKLVSEVERESKIGRKPPARYLTWEEIDRMMSAAGKGLKGARNRVVLLLGIYQGLRASEIAELKWSDVIEDAAGIRLRIRSSKGGTDYIELHPKVKNALDKLKSYYEKYGIETEYVVASLSTNRLGSKTYNGSINFIVKSLAKKANIKNYEQVTAHDLRHTCAVQLLLHGATIEKVSKHLRHKTIQTTMIYTKTMELHMNSAVRYLP